MSHFDAGLFFACLGIVFCARQFYTIHLLSRAIDIVFEHNRKAINERRPDDRKPYPTLPSMFKVIDLTKWGMKEFYPQVLGMQK